MIDPLAFVHPQAKLGKNVTVGPWSYIGADVTLADDCIVESHVVIKGPSTIGQGNHFFQFSSVGEQCQDKKYAGEQTQLIMGDNNIVREGVTIHRGTIQDQGITRIGNDNLLMANAHVAHDCVIGDHCILANSVNLAGHVELGDYGIIGGMTGVHQFVKIGPHAFIGATSWVNQDVPPFVICSGQPCVPRGINSEGLKRRGFDKQTILAIRRGFKILYKQQLPLEEATKQLHSSAESAVQGIAEFIDNSNRGIIR
ncbi:acyl-ACP--UDP-N-acetylglucosamine O-acyltransferase [Psychrobium sp. 1_MG-2023]|uniref:acyl-ACP--UDP-N-acetylglucosamine O-acyltransferase n=1 Tax=Psychrobium sp. 1_MG-2023 TaxID=3062624 RepID=UPI000C347B82|nr:acyl-ACP--UDP-N-acetylglucosamine O-acyltransferase [Psychrobium sp. 1_MG-2023]MDP2559984.1 acyl-ACP--UDP-N-acetylglucosamine O-acyltransferase [Psychrobium sp. 1_MG-2023]PKF56353.1 acyl-[acyl-carrier-protein]--UDP-N-acetylglucosamine O-acyltransferase [Alteromonadales bacterium alter-6D02]